MVKQKCDIVFSVLDNCVKAVFSHSRGLNGLLGISASAPFAKVSAGIHSHPGDAAASSSQGCAAKEKVGWSWTGCVDLTESPGKTLGYGTPSTCLSTKYLSTNQPKLTVQRCFPMEFLTLKKQWHEITAIKIHITTSTHKTYSNELKNKSSAEWLFEMQQIERHT